MINMELQVITCLFLLLQHKKNIIIWKYEAEVMFLLRLLWCENITYVQFLLIHAFELLNNKIQKSKPIARSNQE